MNARVVTIVLLTVSVGLAAGRAEDGVGLGVILGEPTGISVKKWISPEQAIDAAAAWSFSENDSFQFHADYLIHKFGVLKTDPAVGRLPVYFGVGGRLKLKNQDNGRGRNNNDALFGIRIPFGVSFSFAKAPVDLFAEIVPILDVVPDTDLSLNWAIGARFYFR
ncbi:MAG: hypothetical protein HYV36_01070 [Lentisphaerae bacterium]|nr:hypothetical protein [Lentisphaerota bacterium]